jgi:hypothetical protein
MTFFYSEIGLTPEQKAPYCAKLEATKLFTDDVWNTYFLITLTIGAFSMSFLAYTIYFYDNLRVHPAPIVGLFALSVSIMLFNASTVYLICPGNAEVLFAQTVYFDTSQSSMFRAMNTLTYAYLANYAFVFNLPIWLEICMIHDMVKTITCPMERAEARAKYYYIIVIGLQLLTVIIYSFLDYDLTVRIIQIGFYSSKVVYLLCAIPSIIFVMFHFRKGGLNQQYRRLHLKRYVFYAMLFSICNTTQIADYATVTKRVTTPLWSQYACCIYFCVAPILYGIIRLQEPAVIPTLKKHFCRRANASESGSSQHDSDELQDQLNGFLTSSLNVELVYVILKGICKSVNQEDLESFKNGHIPSGGGNDYSLRINIDKIEIFDFKMWEDSRQQNFVIDENCPIETNLDCMLANLTNSSEKLTIEKTVTVDAFFVHSFA